MKDTVAGLLELEGVRGVFIFGASGQLLFRHAHPIFGEDMLGDASRYAVKALDSLQLHHSSWDAITVHYSEGKLLLRNLGQGTMALIADANINMSFVTVASNVAVKKLKVKVEQLAAGGGGGMGGSGIDLGGAPAGGGGASSLSGSGLSTSGLGSSIVTDESTQAFLSTCTKALARSVGPMAKVFVKESARRLAKDGQFTREQIPQLVKLLEEKIENAEDRAKFRRDIAR